MKHIISKAILLACVTGLSACANFTAASGHETIRSANQSPKHGMLINKEHIGEFSKDELQRIAARFPGAIQVAHGADLYKITYWTRLKGNLTQASGLFAVPKDVTKIKGLVAFYHGTNIQRDTAPSAPNRADGNEEAAVFAGNGYMVMLPDYLGLGVSQLPQQYVLTKPQTDASIDMLISLKQIIAPITNSTETKLFMFGFSQGGQTVAGVHRELERHPVRGYKLMASSGVAGPYELRMTSLPKALVSDCLSCTGYLAFAAWSYSEYYSVPLNTALKPEFATSVPKLLDGTKSMYDIAMGSPTDPKAIFTPEFIGDFQANKDNWFTRALDENETYKWLPKRPFRIYYGENDIDVTPNSSHAFYDYAKPRGGNVEIVSLGAVDHQESIGLTFSPLLQWFDELSSD